MMFLFTGVKTPRKGHAVTAITPFSINVPERDLEDLRRRITAIRWPDRETVDDVVEGPDRIFDQEHQ